MEINISFDNSPRGKSIGRKKELQMNYYGNHEVDHGIQANKK